MLTIEQRMEIKREKERLLKEIINNNNKDIHQSENTNVDDEIWHGKRISSNKLPMPTHCLNDKKFCAKEYGALIALSHGGNNVMHLEKNRYVYKNSFNTKQLAQDLGIGRTTLESNIKKLEKLNYNVLEIENSKNGIIYRLNYGLDSIKNTNEVNKFVTINHKMLKELVCAFNSNTIKLYCFLSYTCNENSFTVLTEDYLCENIGLSGKSEKNQSTVRSIIKTLEKCRYIETKKQNIFKWNDELKKQQPKITKSYRLCSFDEWNKFDNELK